MIINGIKMLAKLTYFDYIILATILYSVLSALYQGIIKSGLSFLGWIVSILLTYFISNPVSKILLLFINHDIAVKILSILLSFILIIILIALCNKKIIAMTKEIRGGLFDRSLGFAFGFLRGIVITCVIFKMVALLFSILYSQDIAKNNLNNNNFANAVKNAVTLQLLTQGSDFIFALLPDVDIIKQLKHITNKDKEKNNNKHDDLDINDLLEYLDDNILDKELKLPDPTKEKSNNNSSSKQNQSNDFDDITNLIQDLKSQTKDP